MEAIMDKPAKPPDRLEGRSAVSSAVCVQDPDEAEEQEEPGDREELEEYWRLDEDLFWDEGPPSKEEEYGRLDEDLFWDEKPPGEEDGPMPVRGDWSRGCGEEDTKYISGQTVPTARTYACVEVPEEEKGNKPG